MKSKITALFLLSLFLLPAGLAAGERRIDISPAVLMNLTDGHAGAFMGGAFSADLYLTKAIAIRSTVGYTKDRVYPSNRPYSDANYRTWASFAPMSRPTSATVSAPIWRCRDRLRRQVTPTTFAGRRSDLSRRPSPICRGSIGPTATFRPA